MRSFTLSLCLLGSCAVVAHAQSALTGEIEFPVIASGGGTVSGGGGEMVEGTIGQPISANDTVAGVADETVWIGFWSVIPSDPVSVREERLSRSASGTQITSLAPNPFRERLVIDIELAEASLIVLAVHDELGREVARLIEGPRAIGAHRITWRPQSLPSGTYLLRLEIDGTTRSASPIQHYR